jgi:hypothetical protein
LVFKGVRHAVRVHRDAVRELLIKAQQPPQNAPVPK